MQSLDKWLDQSLQQLAEEKLPDHIYLHRRSIFCLCSVWHLHLWTQVVHPPDLHRQHRSSSFAGEAALAVRSHLRRADVAATQRQLPAVSGSQQIVQRNESDVLVEAARCIRTTGDAKILPRVAQPTLQPAGGGVHELQNPEPVAGV